MPMAAIKEFIPVVTIEAGSFARWSVTLAGGGTSSGIMSSVRGISFSGPGVNGTSSKSSSSSLAVLVGTFSTPAAVVVFSAVPNNSAALPATARGKDGVDRSTPLLESTGAGASTEDPALGGLENKADASIGALLDRWYPEIAVGAVPKTVAAF